MVERDLREEPLAGKNGLWGLPSCVSLSPCPLVSIGIAVAFFLLSLLEG